MHSWSKHKFSQMTPMSYCMCLFAPLFKPGIDSAGFVIFYYGLSIRLHFPREGVQYEQEVPRQGGRNSDSCMSLARRQQNSIRIFFSDIPSNFKAIITRCNISKESATKTMLSGWLSQAKNNKCFVSWNVYQDTDVRHRSAGRAIPQDYRALDLLKMIVRHFRL